MAKLRVVVAFLLAAISVGAIAWCAYVARPVPGGLRLAPDVSAPIWETLSGAWAGAPGAQRDLTTRVTVDSAGPADVRGVPEGRLDERELQVKITVVHRLELGHDDPLVASIRSNGAFPERIQTFIDSGLGAVKIDNVLRSGQKGTAPARATVLAPTTRLAPILNTAGTRASVQFTVILLRQVRLSDLLVLGFRPPESGKGLVRERKVSIDTTRWTVTQVLGVAPGREEYGRLEFTAESPEVSVTLAYRSYGFPDQVENEAVPWAIVLGILTAIVLVVFMARALGPAWWRRLPNRELAAGMALCAAALAISFFTKGASQLLAPVVLFGLLPLLSVRHANRVIPARPPWTTTDVLTITGVAVLVAFGMLVWSGLHAQVPVQTLLIAGTVAAVAAAGSAAVSSADLGIGPMLAKLAAAAAGTAIGALALALWVRALMSGAWPPDSLRLVLGLCWSLIAIAGIAVATRHWSRGATLAAVLAALLVQGWPGEWLDQGSWSVQADQLLVDLPTVGSWPLDEIVRGVLGLIVLAFVLLVLRLRRLGDSVTAISNPAVQATMIVCLMVVYITPRKGEEFYGFAVPVPSLAITSLVAWVAARWLLAGPPLEVAEPATRREHRERVRDALHHRLLRISEQELYRLGRGKLGAGELTMDSFDKQRTDIEGALAGQEHRAETAFASSAGCTPWHNGLAAFVVSLLLSLPFALLSGWPSSPDFSLFVFDSRLLFTLPAFGFLYGYFYPRLRGTQPVTKALFVMTAALVTELSAYAPALIDPDLGGLFKAQVVMIVVGQVALVFIGLGLYWEWRIMHLAGEPWGRVRNVRSVRSLATPLLAVVIAAGTTAATSAAGKTVDRILKGETVAAQER